MAPPRLLERYAGLDVQVYIHHVHAAALRPGCLNADVHILAALFT